MMGLFRCGQSDTLREGAAALIFGSTSVAGFEELARALVKVWSLRTTH